MGSRLGRRVVHFANLPIKLLMPTSFTNITEIALKTIPSASKIEIKRVLESLYGFEVEKVQTLNMEGKKKKRGGILLAKPDYKKAYVTLRTPLSISPDLFPIKVIEEEKNATNKQSTTSIVTDVDRKMSHWLDADDKLEKGPVRGRRGGGREGFKSPPQARRGGGGREETTKFPWSNMRSASK
ncbi:hypothetical protein V2J09_016313 [Rumex salicifolius]